MPERKLVQRGSTVEYVREPGCPVESREIILFVDKEADRLGVMPRNPAEGDTLYGLDGRFQVSLSHLLDLLKRAGKI